MSTAGHHWTVGPRQSGFFECRCVVCGQTYLAQSRRGRYCSGCWLRAKQARDHRRYVAQKGQRGT